MFTRFKYKYQDGEPCSHPGCKSHTSHPCENCGRIGAHGQAGVVEWDYSDYPIGSLETLVERLKETYLKEIECRCRK